MKKLIIGLFCVALMAIAFVNSAQAIPECTCFGYAFYNGQPVSGLTVKLYYRGQLIATQTPPGNCFFLGEMSAVSGRYSVSITDSTGNWANINFYHVQDECTGLGDVDLKYGPPQRPARP